MPGSKEQQYLTTVQEWFEKCRKARMKFEQQWYMNLAFYFGRQYVQWARGSATTLNRLYEPPAPPWRVRLVSNKIRPIIRTEMAKLVKEKPTCFVIPATSEDEDLAAAKAGEAIYEHVYRSIGLEKVTRRMTFWLSTTGTSFIKDWWDPNKMGSDGIQGAISAEPVTPFHFYVPEVQEEELENQPYVFHVLAKSPTWVQDTFGKTVQADSTVGGDVLQQKFLKAVGIMDLPQDYVAVKECWIKKCKDFPEGAVVTYANDTILSVAEGWPYTHDEYPFTKFEHIQTGQFYSESVLTDLIPLQKEYNRTRSQLIEAKNRMAKPQLIAPKGSVDPSKITSEPGLVILYTPGFNPPSPIALSSMPNYVLEEVNRTESDMNDISAQHQISKGGVPPGIHAATAISFLQEQDDSKLASSISSIEEGTERIGRHILSYVQQFWQEEREVRVVGDDGIYETKVFDADSIQGNTDMKVEAGSATPRSAAAKQSFIMELGKMGWIPPDRALRYLDMSETGRMYEELQIDSRQAQRENLKMMNGETVPVNTWDNDLAHITEHDNFRKKQSFERLDDQTKTLFESHVNDHRLKLQQANMPPGGPGEPTPPGAPPGPGPGGPPGGMSPPGPTPPSSEMGGSPMIH